MKRILFLIVCVIFFGTMMLFGVQARDFTYEKTIALSLHELGLMNGTGTDADGAPLFELERTPTRMEAIVMLIRLLGKEQDALSNTYQYPFTDVADWADKYVGYAYENGLTYGISNTLFGSSDPIEGYTFITFVLRALGYDDTKGDFVWNDPFDFAEVCGILRENTDTENFMRADCAIVSYKALSASMKGKETLLSEYLIQNGVFTKEVYEKAIEIAQAATDPYAYRDLYPDLYVSTPELVYSDAPKVTYLTFDDGPSAAYTSGILDVLKKYGIKATFFVVGTNAERNTDLLVRMVEEGHFVCVHTYSHDFNTVYDSVEAYLHDFYKVYSIIKEATGTTPYAFRMPGGSVNSYNKETRDAIAEEMLRRGFVYYDWTATAGDTAINASAEACISNVRNYSVLDHSILLCHDVKKITAENVEQYIKVLMELGYSFETLYGIPPYVYLKK